jgi:hypothetical protein
MLDGRHTVFPWEVEPEFVGAGETKTGSGK